MATLPAAGPEQQPGEPVRQISIIVPVLNEAVLLGRFLYQVRAHAQGAEIVVVDGGSVDGTAEMARNLADQVLPAPRGRAVQMNEGARVARGDVLWFLHADSDVPSGCLQEINRALQDPRTAGGYFRLRIPNPQFAYRLTDALAHYLGVLVRIRCGDHGIFCRRRAFEAVGGYPEVPLMEDVDLFRALHRCGRMRASARRITTSARRYEEIGPYRLTAAYTLILALYLCGASRSFLAQVYRKTCVRR